jgi:hypothetical protein
MNYGVISIYVTPVQIICNQSLPNPPQCGPLVPLLISFPLCTLLDTSSCSPGKYFFFLFFSFFLGSRRSSRRHKPLREQLYVVARWAQEDYGLEVQHFSTPLRVDSLDKKTSFSRTCDRLITMITIACVILSRSIILSTPFLASRTAS